MTCGPNLVPGREEFTHPVFPVSAGLVQGQQLGGGQPDPRRFGPDQAVLRDQDRTGQGLLDAVGEPVGPAVPRGPGELDQLEARRAGQVPLGRPALRAIAGALSLAVPR
jgi:hypothetical protein